MTMGWRGTVVLLLSVLAAAAVFWLESPGSGGPHGPGDADSGVRPTAAPARPLLEFPAADVESLRLLCSGTTRFTERRPDGWSAVERPGSIDDFLRNLGGLGILADVGSGAEDASEFGLAPPRFVVEFRLRARTQPFVLQIGDHNPSMTGVYVRRGGDGPVMMAGSLVRWEVENACKRISG